MKGFVFTLDAVFSIIFAAAAISGLIYVSYSSYTPPSTLSSAAGSLGGALLSANLQGMGQGSPLYGMGSPGSWPQYGANEGFSFGGQYGPAGPYLIYSYQASANIIPAPVVGGGYVAFAAGNQVYEVSAATGALAANYPVRSSSAIAGAPVFYRNLLIYANASGYLTAVSASGGLARMWSTNIGYLRITSPLVVDEGYLVFGAKGSTAGTGTVYFLDPSNGTVVESDLAPASWIAHHKGWYYIGISSGTFGGGLRGEGVNVSVYPYNGFASYGNFALLNAKGSVAMYGNLTASYNRGAGVLSLTSVPYYGYAHRSNFSEAAALFNTTPSIGGNVTYLLYNGIYFQAFRQGGMLFNVTLPAGQPYWYNYSDIALAYGNAYLAKGNTLYAFGAGGGAVPQNTSLLAALGSLYLSGRGSLADYALYNAYGSGNIGIFINGTYAPSLHVSKFNGFDSYIAIPATNSLSPEAPGNNAISLCGWYRINSLAGYNGLLIKGTEFAVDSGGVAPQRGFTVGNPSNPAASYNSPISANAVGPWNSFCFTYNQSASYYYLNGTQYAATLNNGISLSAGSNALILGRGAAGYSNVSVANLQLYNFSLPASSVSGINSEGMYGEPPNFSGLVGWWPLLGDGNDYGGAGHVGFPNNVVYAASNPVPGIIGRSVQVGSSAAPLQLTSNGVSRLFNVSVVIWSG